jgi:hypothetical protein
MVEIQRRQKAIDTDKSKSSKGRGIGSPNGAIKDAEG